MIVEMARGHIRYRHANGRTVTIEVEALLPGHGGPDFVIFANSIRRWEPPDHHRELAPAEREEILAGLKEDLTVKGIAFDVE